MYTYSKTTKIFFCIFSKSLTILLLMFRASVYLELSLMYWMRWGSRFIVSHV